MDVMHNAVMGGLGENYYLHGGKSKNFKLINNKFIQDSY